MTNLYSGQEVAQVSKYALQDDQPIQWTREDLKSKDSCFGVLYT